MKKISLLILLLISYGSYAAEPRWQDFWHQDDAPVAPVAENPAPEIRRRTDEEILRHFNGASFMRDFLNDGKKMDEEARGNGPQDQNR